ncbi:hypothetical protein DPMN_170361 [Dreissena polymorpha]|uniref:Uncharacterized protein n=1 Tax=Dreissena polymorpha TaxID=45954 RepID=A0A9D4IEI2_DREPO|nr:hypothetical protein DPMN_170361 [Dreissena polymorpha]
MAAAKESEIESDVIQEEAVSLGKIIKETGDFGLFQIIGTVISSLDVLVLSWSMMTMAYSASVPKFTCVVFQKWNQCDVIRHV